jgi:hypothetical protein
MMQSATSATESMTALESLPPRLLARTKIVGDCWFCGPNPKHYGQYRINGRIVSAHRFVYELLIGPIPQGLQIDHLCRQRSCINPAHLEAVPPKENIRRGLSGYFGDKHKGKGGRPWMARTHCKHDHPFEGYNLIINWRGERVCRACYNASRRRIYAKKHGYGA